MKRWSVVASLGLGLGCGLALSCDDGAIEGPTVRADLVVNRFNLAGPNRIATGATVCLVHPVVGACDEVDDAGFASLDFPAESEIIVRLEGEGDYPTMAPLTTGTEDFFGELFIYPDNVVDVVALLLEVEVDPTAGQVTMGANPHQPSNAGLSYEVFDAETGEPSDVQPFYLSEDGLPDPNATSTPSNGFSGLINAPPGEYLVVVPYNERCQIFAGWRGTAPDGSPAMRIPVEAGVITFTQWTGCTPP